MTATPQTAVPYPTRAFLGGDWRDIGRTYTVTNPATGAVPFTGTSGVAPAGDYASVATGNWNAGATWQHCLTSTGATSGAPTR